MRHGFFSRLALRHPFGRWFPALLVVLQIVAPMWHVCALGGHCEANGHHTEVWKPKCGGGRLCSCKKPAGALYSPTGEVLDNVSPASSSTCLARELMSMGRMTVAPLTLDFQITRVRAPRPQNAPRRLVFAFDLPLSRGPPSPSVV